MSHFILYIEEVNNFDIKISLKFGDVFYGEITEFISLKDTAFIKHPHAPKYFNEFPDYECARIYKNKWEIFLQIYLDKSRRFW